MTEEKRRRRTCGGCRHFIRDVDVRVGLRANEGTCAEHGHDVEFAGEARSPEGLPCQRFAILMRAPRTAQERWRAIATGNIGIACAECSTPPT